MGDPQLALLLCRLICGSAGSTVEQRLLQQLKQKVESSSSSDEAAAAATCLWLQADTMASVGALLNAEESSLAAAAEHAAQLLPLLRLMLPAMPALQEAQRKEWQQQVQRCLWCVAAALRSCGLHVLAVQALAAAQLDNEKGKGGPASQEEALLQNQLLAVALLPAVLQQHSCRQHHADAGAAQQLQHLQQRGVPVDAAAVLSQLRWMREGILAASLLQQNRAWMLGWMPPAASQARPHALERQQSSGGSSYRSRDSEQRPQAQQRAGMPSAVVGEGCVAAAPKGNRLPWMQTSTGAGTVLPLHGLL